MLTLNRVTVYQNMRLDAVSSVYRRRHSTSKLDVYRPCLQTRWGKGCYKVIQLYREIAEQCYSGTYDMVNEWAQQQRFEPAPNTLSVVNSQ